MIAAYAIVLAVLGGYGLHLARAGRRLRKSASERGAREAR